MIIGLNKHLRIARNNHALSEYYFDLNKHYPLFKLFDLSNDENLKSFTDYYINSLYFLKTNQPLLSRVEYNIKHLQAFLEDKRNNTLPSISSGSYNMVGRIQELINYSSLKERQDVVGRYVIYSTYSMSINNEFLFLLCIKPEYIYYVKLCILLNQEIEFDCFYILVKKGGESLLRSRSEIRMYNIIKKAIKYYGCNLIYVDSIENEVNMSINLPKFNTMKDYNNWLDQNKKEFIDNVVV